MTVDAVFFDAWDTLFFISASRTEQFLQAVRPFGLTWSAEEVEKALDEAARFYIPHDHDPATLEEEQEVWRRFFAACLQNLGTTPQPDIVKRLVDEVFSFRWLQLFPETLEVLKVCRQHCKVGLISNAWASMRQLMDTLGLAPYFHACIISAEVGVRKPDPRIFQIALQTLGVPAERSVFVDDDLKNVQVAQQLGIHAFWLNRTDQSQDAPWKLRNLTELLHRLQLGEIKHSKER